MKTKLTLNVGSGDRTFLFYPDRTYKCINLDMRMLPNKTDIVSDVRQLPFPDATFQYALCSDVLEHFPLVETEKILTEWRRIIKPGGIIEFRVPDLENICREYLRHKNAKYTSWCLYGAQNYVGNYHYICFDRVWLNSMVEPIGFKEVEYRSEGNNFVMKVEKL
jgi:ubiquinone/menaquinone biosynthesis C-methylase UbiE